MKKRTKKKKKTLMKQNISYKENIYNYALILYYNKY